MKTPGENEKEQPKLRMSSDDVIARSTIPLVDDEDAFRTRLRIWLEACGSLIIMDMCMPMMDGLEAAETDTREGEGYGRACRS